MVEVNLDKTLTCVLYHMKILAAVRCMCREHGLEVDWCLEWEREVADVGKSLRLAIEKQGPLLKIE